MNLELLYWSTALLVVGALGTSWLVARNTLHPHFVLTVAMVGLWFTNYLIVGSAGFEAVGIAAHLTASYHVHLLLVFVGIWLGTLAIDRIIRPKAHLRARLVINSPWLQRYLFWIASLIVGVELLNRIYLSDWSVANAFLFSVGARGSAPWHYEQWNLGDEKFIYALVRILLPISALSYAFLALLARGIVRLLAIVGLLIATLLLFSEGSRTPLVLTCAALVLIFWRTETRKFKRVALVSVLLVGFATILSAMYLYRATGLVAAEDEPLRLVYQQDDNYYRSIAAMEIADTTSERWSPTTFAFTTMVNPIPRALWPAKPALLADFWGNYKSEWHTISFLGELVAMFGLVGGCIGAIGIGMLVYLMLCAATRFVPWPAGILLYMITALYAYMILRSLQNVTQFMYLPIAALCIFWFAGLRTRVAHRGSNGQALSGGSTQ